MNETHILISLLRMYIPRNWEFGSALAKLLNLGGGGLTPQSPLGTPLVTVTVLSYIKMAVYSDKYKPMFRLNLCDHIQFDMDKSGSPKTWVRTRM
jgi:hypothetical protein